MKKKEKEQIQEQEVVEPVDKSVISSHEVEEAVHGDEEALAEQMERVKNLTKEQQLEAIELEKRKAAEKKAQEEARIAAEKKAQEEAKIAAEKKAQEEARLAAELKAQEEARLAEEKKVQEELARKNAEKEALEQQAASVKEENTTPQKEKGGPSTFKRIMAIILFIAFLAMIYYLPEITQFINDYKASKAPKEVITTGVSTCKLSKTSSNLDIDITASFSIVNSKLYKLTYLTITKGDKVSDKEDLDSLYNECMTLKKEAGELDGVTISCSLNNGINSNKQILDYEKLDVRKVTSAYTEAGGIYPEFQKNENIDKIEGKMLSAGYECTRS